MATLGTFTSGQVLTAAELNAIGTWTTFTPSWTNLTVGNGTVSAKYTKINDLLFCKVFVTLGSTSSVGDPVGMTLPASVSTDTAVQNIVGVGYTENAGIAGYLGSVQLGGSTLVRPVVLSSSISHVGTQLITTTNPFIWGTGDKFAMDFMVIVS